MAAVVTSTFASEDIQSKGHNVEVVLSLIGDMTSNNINNTALTESGVRAIALVLRSIPMASVHVSSQGAADVVSLYSAHTVDSCLAKLSQLCDDAATYLEKAASSDRGKGELPSDISDWIHLALAIIENTSDCLDYMCEGSDSLLRSHDIWKSTLEQCRPIAVYLSKLFAAVCRLFTVSTSQAFVPNQDLLHQRLDLYKRCSKVIETISGIFGAEVHLKTDLGMKRSLMERYCEHALAAHKPLMSAPPSLKAVLTSLCAIVTKFSAASFDNAKQCQRVVIRCSGTVRELASQLMTLLLRLDASSMHDPKINKRVKSSLMVIRFIVFRISPLLPRARDQEARSSALSMLDTLFGEVLSAKTLLRLPGDISSTVVTLICAVSRKFALSLFTSDTSSLTRHLDILSRHTGENMPLIKGLNHHEAHCEMIRVVCCELGSFSTEDQAQLLGHQTSILAAFAMAMDHDPLFTVLPATSDSYIDSNDQHKDCSSYQQLVASIASSSCCLSSADTFRLWEAAVLTGAMHKAGRSLGYKILFEAWKLVAKSSLDPVATESTISSIVSAILEEVPGLALIRILPWDLLDPENANDKTMALMADMAENIIQCISQTGLHGSNSAATFSAFEAVVPGIRMLNPQRKIRLIETMYSYAYTVMEKCLAADQKPIALLSSLAGNFALSSDVTAAELTSSMASLQAIVSHILQDGQPWIAQHEILVHIFQAASDAGKEPLVQALVRNGGEDKLVRFLGQQASGKETGDIETQAAVYSSIFNTKTALYGATNGTAYSGEVCDTNNPHGPSERKVDKKLWDLGIDDAAIIEYCTGILEDSTEDPEEKQEAILGYLEAVSDTDFSKVVQQAIAKLSEASAEKEKELQAEAKEKLGQALEAEKKELQENSGDATGPVKKQLTLEERRRREKLLSKYDHNDMEIVERPDGEAEIVYHGGGLEKPQDTAVRNSNVQMVLDKEKAQRENSRAAHQKKIEKDKELQERERLKKEKEMRRTMKKEKRRIRWITSPKVQKLFEGIKEGNRGSLSRGITLVESTRSDHREQARELVAACARVTQRTRAMRIGLTGTPGVGKSTFIEAFGMMLVNKGHRVSVMAVDPSSKRSGGSVLGDKTRMQELSVADGAYVRPSPSRGTLGGVARNTLDSIILAEASGYDICLVETVGVGQSETMVSEMVDMFILLMQPGSGDELQGVKRGIMELADLVVINKADGALASAARQTRTYIMNALHLMIPRKATWTPKAIRASAVTGHNLDRVWDSIQRYFKVLDESGEWSALRREQQKKWMWREVTNLLLNWLEKNPETKEYSNMLEAEVASGRLPPAVAAEQIVTSFLNSFPSHPPRL
ncbi:hypothetical protein IW138_004376 [Coemansia sp. RSA 986]|nr:hypothetical protein IW138_004376 [Coemansia sp. RSA 986]